MKEHPSRARLSPEHRAALIARKNLPQETQKTLNGNQELYSLGLKTLLEASVDPEQGQKILDSYFSMLERDHPDYLAALQALDAETTRVLEELYPEL
jgi:hypothetical protein